MAEINMNDYSTFDENVNALQKDVETKDNAEYYLNNFINKIQGEGSIGKIRNEVYNFIYTNTKMDTDTKKKLIEFADGNYLDGKQLSTDIINYLKGDYEEKTDSYDKANAEVDDMKSSFVGEYNAKLESMGIKTEGNDEDLKESIKTKQDMDSLNEKAIDMEKKLENNEDNIYISTNDLIDTINNPTENTLEDKVDQQIVENSDLSVTPEGTVEVKGNLLDNEKENKMAMLLGGLTTSEMALDMYLTKEKDNSEYKVTFGNLPVKNHPENRLDPEAINKINEINNSYDRNINYTEILNSKNMAVATFNNILFSEMKKEGIVKAGINNRDGNINLGLNVSGEYQNLTDALNTNGAVVSMDNMENSVIKISGNTLDQTTVLTNTKQTLEKEETNELVNNYQYIKKIEPPKNEAARVSPTFLIVVAIMEVILIGFYLVMMFN